MYNYKLQNVWGSEVNELHPARDRGEQVVSHVMSHVKEPMPDFASMQRLIQCTTADQLPPFKTGR